MPRTAKATLFVNEGLQRRESWIVGGAQPLNPRADVSVRQRNGFSEHTDARGRQPQGAGGREDRGVPAVGGRRPPAPTEKLGEAPDSPSGSPEGASPASTLPASATMRGVCPLCEPRVCGPLLGQGLSRNGLVAGVPSLLQQSLHPLVCPDCQVTRLFAPSSVGQWVRADIPTPHRLGGPAPPEHLGWGPPFPTHGQLGLAGWPGPRICTGCPEHQLSRLPSASVGSPRAAGWGAVLAKVPLRGDPVILA